MAEIPSDGGHEPTALGINLSAPQNEFSSKCDFKGGKCGEETARPGEVELTGHESAFNGRFKGQPKRTKRSQRKEVGVCFDSAKGSDVSPTEGAMLSTDNVASGTDKKDRKQGTKKAAVQHSGRNESDRDFSASYRKNRSKKGKYPGNVRANNYADSYDKGSFDTVLADGVFSQSKKNVRGSQASAKKHSQTKQIAPLEVHSQEAFSSHGTVTGDSVYVRKERQSLHQHFGVRKKQWTASNKGSHRNFFEKHAKDMFPFSKVPDQSPSISKEHVPDGERFSAHLRATKFHKGGQSSMQATMLIEQLVEEKYECMVCCEVIRCTKAVWNCSSCYHIFHLFCIKRWARSPVASAEDNDGRTSGWRCPACQFIQNNVPNAYRCFCGKLEEPKWYPREGITPHSCGELCLKKRIGKDCPHPCNQLCHPGPCPSCPVTITKRCCCGKTVISVRCGNSSNVTCSSVCEKTLNCKIHFCQESCHSGPCQTCSVVQEQCCYCGKTSKEATCGSGSPTEINGKPGYFSCEAVCSKKLDCGNHDCSQICHPSQCASCPLQPAAVKYCPCGKQTVVELLNGSDRNSCLDPIPTCGNLCECFLPCAKYNDITKSNSGHRCKKLCHHGPCSSCEGSSVIKCRCRATSKKVLCAELNVTGELYLCELKCNKKLDCGRHRCNKKCCPGTEHKCTLTCGKRLKCGQHKCMEACHSGSCPPCLIAEFNEVVCPCGATIQEPPIPCGKPPPACPRPCSRMHPCQHEVDHNCHYEEHCPPCTVLVSKQCMGGHKLRHNIPCHIKAVSCGEPCGKALPCGKHKCQKMCHEGPCLEENEKCNQLCISPREGCGHPCNAPCHDGNCPKIPCKSKIQVFCKCGRRAEEAVCLKGGDKMEAALAYQRFTTKNLADKIRGLQGGQTVDISGLMNLDEQKSHLDCDEECAIEQRNRVVADALGISSPDYTSGSAPLQFTPFLEEHGRANMKFLYFVEDVFENLVNAVAKAQSHKLIHSFPSMNNKNRRFIHELATCYGCTSISYDQEPKRNTVVTATKKLSSSPRVKLSSHIQRHTNPQPPPPVPVLPEYGIGNVRFIPRKSQETSVVDYFTDDF